MYKAIFFDFDGVLTVDPTGTISIMNYIKDETDLDLSKFESAYRKHNFNLLYGIKTHLEVWPEICKDTGCNIDINVLYDSFINTPLDFDMFSLVKELKSKGYIIAMITDNKSDRIKKILEHHELEYLFDIITISADVASGKKEKKIFDETLKKKNLNYNECIFIDNSKANLVIPSENDMETIFYDHIKRDFTELKNKLNSILNI